MKAIDLRTGMRHRAEDELRLLLSQVSTIKFRDICHESLASRAKGRFIAHIEVLGRSRALACEVKAHALAANLRKTIEELNEDAAHLAPGAIPVLIVPHLSADAQAVCREFQAGFVDFEGNARLSVDDVFIVKRSMRARHEQPQALKAVIDRPAVLRPPAPTLFVSSNIPGAESRLREAVGPAVGVF